MELLARIFAWCLSDHNLVVIEVQIKLVQRSKPAQLPWPKGDCARIGSRTTPVAYASLPKRRRQRRRTTQTHKGNSAKRAARKDRISGIHAQLEADPSATKAAWTTAHSQKKGFVGARKHLVVDGKPQPRSKTHEAFCDPAKQAIGSARNSRPHCPEAQ